MRNHTDPRRWLIAGVRQPAAHFLLLGALLFAVAPQLPLSETDGKSSDETLVITAAQVAQLRQDWQRSYGRLPTPPEEEALLNDLINEELLYREAIRLGLDRSDLIVWRRLIEKMRVLASDPDLTAEELYREAMALGLDREDMIVRQRLIQKMRLLAAAEGGAVRASEAEMRDYLARHRDRFMQPARARLSHVFLSRDQHQDDLDESARRLLEELRRQAIEPRRAAELGDPFLLGNHWPSLSRSHLERSLGAEFGTRAMQLEPGRWSGPVASAYGLHLVWVHEQVPAADPDPDVVRQQVMQLLRAERRQERIAAKVEHLRQRFAIHIERPPLPTEDAREEMG